MWSWERPLPSLTDKLREILNRHGTIQDASGSWETKQLIQNAIEQAVKQQEENAQMRALLEMVEEDLHASKVLDQDYRLIILRDKVAAFLAPKGE